MEKVILISIDGMRPDGFLKCGNEFIHDMMNKWAYTLEGRTVMPSLTLPCHISMFHGVPPQIHGTYSNIYITPEVPVIGLMEKIKEASKTNAMYYSWEQLREISRPGMLKRAGFCDIKSSEGVDRKITDMVLKCAAEDNIDFIFAYLGETDDKGGHGFGWMSQEYLNYINEALENVKRIYEDLGSTYNIIVTADHGGHDRTHGTDSSVDMTIPMFFWGKRFEAGKNVDNASILDIAPTVCDLLGIVAAKEWIGKSLLQDK